MPKLLPSTQTTQLKPRATRGLADETVFIKKSFTWQGFLAREDGLLWISFSS